MEILSDILKNPKSVSFSENKIKISGLEYDKNMEIEIKETTKKKYTLEQLAYFLCNKHLQYTKYLRECKTKGILSIFYSDQKIILEEVEKENEVESQGRYDLPESKYYSKHDYHWVKDLIAEKTDEILKSKITEKYKIIVSSSLTATVNLSNIEILLTSGSLEKSQDLIFDKTEFKIKSHVFVAEEDIKDWTSDDWNMLVAIFCDGSEWQINEWGIGDVASLFNTVPTFYIVNTRSMNKNDLSGYNVIKWNVVDNKLDDEKYKLMWSKIKNTIKNKK
ncbi:cell division control protein 73 (CDC83) [Vairimorpha necatrix]|uniref:Cell division control protein 73 (CDC83) n=1 Tax=Vairimorpha necatrix TaxID=6039 RepID=A0AAX4J8F6_9MICR